MSAFDNDPKERLLRALAEQLKIPILQIARAAELAEATEVEGVFREIEYTADMTLRLIDSYLLSVRLQALPTMELQPVSVSAVLQDAAQRLDLLARQYGCDLEIDLGGKYGPVMAHPQSLEAAYISLGYAFIEAVPPSDQRHTVVLAAHRSGNGLVTGIFGNQPNISGDMFRRAKALYGSAGQSAPGLTGNNGAGIFIADSLLQTMASPLRVAHHNKLTGLAATLLPSKQLQLI